MSAYSDEQLVLEALGDSHQAFAELVEQYQHRVLRTIASIISDEQAAQDMAQETFLSAWSNLAKLKERHKFGRWLNQIAISYSKRWLRDQRKHLANTVALEENSAILMEERNYQREKLRQEVWDAIDELAADHREAVVLHYISGYSYKEISEMLAVPFSTIVGRIQQARNQLRKEFLDMVTKLQLEIDSTVHRFLEERAKRDGLSIEALILRLIERYRRDADKSGVVTRLIRNNAQMFISKVSPGGRYLSYVNWATSGNLAIYDLETGESRDITDEASQGWDKQFADVSVWSPDGKQIVYGWSNGPYRNWDNELRIVDIDDSKSRVLCSFPPKSGFLSPRAWSRDGKHILAYRCKYRGTVADIDIVLVSVSDGSIRTLKSLGPGRIRHYMNLSPDGRYVVYDWPQSAESSNRDIFLVATDGSHEITLVEHPANDLAPFWSPDGNWIVFMSDRSGSEGIWILEVVDGKPKGTPQLIKHNLNGVFPLGMTQDGSYYYGFTLSDSDIYMAALDPETGEIVKPPAKAVQNFEGFNYSPAFSPDGKYLAYVSRRPRAWASEFRVLVIRSLETGEERIISPENVWVGHHPCWAPDGRSILISAVGLDIYRIDVETGTATPVIQSDEQGDMVLAPFALFPDGNRIFFMRWVDGVKVIRIYDLEAEREWQPDFLLTCGEGYGIALAPSPDGQHLAFVVSCDDEWSVQIAPSTGGETRELFRLRKEETAKEIVWLVWTPDGRHLLFPRKPKEKATATWLCELWRIPVKGGEPQNLGITMNLIGGRSFHPDGSRIVFTAPGSGRGAEVWAMENFLPGFTASN